MSYRPAREQDIAYETPCGKFWVLKTPKMTHYEVYRVTITHSVRCAIIGEGAAPNLGLIRAIAVADQRASEAASKEVR